MLKKVGILGFGIVGKSVLKFLRSTNSDLEIGVWDQKKLNDSEKKLIKYLSVKFYSSALEDFFNLYDQIVVSPGIPLNKFIEFKDKCLCELDFFTDHFKKKTIAVTGALGKTTVVNLLGKLIPLINKNQKVIVAGNIGNGMLDLIFSDQKADMAVLELSSFQLTLNKKFAPDVALITNFYPNHLDWHSDINDYFDAKCKIFEYQKAGQCAIFPASFLQNQRFLKKLKTIKSNVYFVYNSDMTVGRKKQLFYEKNNHLFLDDKKIFDLNILPDFSFRQNWLFVLAAMHLLGLDLKRLVLTGERIFLPHRLEYFANVNGIAFYNDSKSTIMPATLAALKKLDQKNKPIILILGGLSKGIDRKPFIKNLSSIKNLKKVFCFGQDCCDLEEFECFASLQEVLYAAMQVAQQEDKVLFSPGGASFDLFKNYAHRGEIFKKLVLSLQ